MIRGMIFFTLWIGIFLLIWTQFIRPMLASTPILPFFRRRGALNRDLAEAREDLDLIDEEMELARMRQEAAEQRRQGAEGNDSNADTPPK